MYKNKIFYCEIIDRTTGKTLASYENIKAKDWYYARHIVASKYAKENNGHDGNWYADSVEINEDEK